MYQAMAEAGLQYGSDISITFEGAGPMAGMLNKMGSSSIATEVTAVATDPLADDLFAVPGRLHGEDRQVSVPGAARSAALLSALATDRPVIAAELRPPRTELDLAAGMDAWIDTYHAVRRLTRQDTFVFLTDSAVGSPEEDNLRHLITNLGDDVPRERIVPFLTTKHTLGSCLRVCGTRRGASVRRHSSCSAAIGTSGRRAASSTRGSCARRSAHGRPSSCWAGGRIRTRRRATGGLPARSATDRGVLPDADRLAPQICPRCRGSSGS